MVTENEFDLFQNTQKPEHTPFTATFLKNVFIRKVIWFIFY